jgi:hypothetical protein
MLDPPGAAGEGILRRLRLPRAILSADAAKLALFPFPSPLVGEGGEREARAG